MIISIDSCEEFIIFSPNCYKGVWQLVPGWDPRGLNTHRFSEGPLLRQGKSQSDCEIGTCMCTMPASREGQNGSWPRGSGADAQPRAWRHDSGHVGTQRSWHKLVLRGLVSQRHMAAELFFSRMKGLGAVGPLTRLKVRAQGWNKVTALRPVWYGGTRSYLLWVCWCLFFIYCIDFKISNSRKNKYPGKYYRVWTSY